MLLQFVGLLPRVKVRGWRADGQIMDFHLQVSSEDTRHRTTSGAVTLHDELETCHEHP